MLALADLNTLDAAEFTRALSGIFEHSDWIAARAAAQRPFHSRAELLAALIAVVARASEAEQLGLIRAHPQLAARSVRDPALTRASTQEQRRAGLDGCTPAEAMRLAQLNTAYLARFGFPFILAVRGHDPASIIERCERRLGNDGASERATALAEIGRIAGLRLEDRVSAAR